MDELISSHHASLELSRELIAEIRKGSESEVSAANARTETAKAEARAAMVQLEKAHLEATFELRALQAEQAKKAAEEELRQLRAQIASGPASSSQFPPQPDRRQVQPTAAKSMCQPKSRAADEYDMLRPVTQELNTQVSIAVSRLLYRRVAFSHFRVSSSLLLLMNSHKTQAKSSILRVGLRFFPGRVAFSHLSLTNSHKTQAKSSILRVGLRFFPGRVAFSHLSLMNSHKTQAKSSILRVGLRFFPGRVVFFGVDTQIL